MVGYGKVSHRTRADVKVCMGYLNMVRFGVVR